MAKELTPKQQQMLLSKLKKIIGKEKKRLNPEKDIEIENAKIKNYTQAIPALGARSGNFIGMLTTTIASKEHRISLGDDLEIIIQKTRIMYHSFLYFMEKLKKELKKHKYEIIYLMSFELQKDSNLHAHIYFSMPLKAFELFFKFYHQYTKTVITERKKVILNKREVVIIPIGRSQLGIAEKFREKLEESGYEFEYYFNPEKSDRIDWRCKNFVSKAEFKSGSWPTLYFYGKKEIEKNYGEKIVKYLTKDYTKQTRQKALGSAISKHNTKTVYEEEEWNEIQKKFIQKVCGRLYTASRLPIQISWYQKKRKQIIEIYPQYRNMNTLVTDLLNGKATYNKKTGVLICSNGESIQLK